jgi:hypothetical protein
MVTKQKNTPVKKTRALPENKVGEKVEIHVECPCTTCEVHVAYLAACGSGHHPCSHSVPHAERVNCYNNHPEERTAKTTNPYIVCPACERVQA